MVAAKVISHLSLLTSHLWKVEYCETYETWNA